MLHLSGVEDSTYTTTSGAARILQVSEGTVRQMVERGELAAIRTDSGNRARLFDRGTVERLARDRANRQPAETR
jgi:excisionase family DNA binding protein